MKLNYVIAALILGISFSANAGGGNGREVAPEGPKRGEGTKAGGHKDRSAGAGTGTGTGGGVGRSAPYGGAIGDKLGHGSFG